MGTTVAKRKKSTRKTSATITPDQLREAYVQHILNFGHRPPSVFKFCTDLGITEEVFYDQYGSFDGIERAIWNKFINDTTDRLLADDSYGGFSSREKILAFYFTLFEELKQSRSFVLIQLQNRNRLEMVPEFLKGFKSSFEKYIVSVLETGKAAGEVAKRPYLDSRYPGLFWVHTAFLLMYWRDDNSVGFQNTDAAIEKSVNLAFDLIGKGAVDSVIDFAKFLYQTKVV